LNLFIKPLGINYYENYLLISIYYLIGAACAFGLALRFESRQSFLGTREVIQLSALVLVLVYVLEVANAYFPTGRASKESLESFGFFFPLWEYQSSLSKLADIVFQQVMIFCLVRSLKTKIELKGRYALLFSILFFVMHLPLFVVLPDLAIYLAPGSLAAGLVFVSIHLYSKKSLLYSILVHWCFYLIISIYFRYWI
jgi:hypothetical protein